MNRLLGVLLRLLLLLLLLALLGAGGWLLHTRLGWTWLEVSGLGLGCLALLLLVLLVRRLYYRHREERFVRKMVEFDRTRLSGEDQEQRLAELRERWRKGVAMLRHSDLARAGNAIYALPWFMVLGESGSGKSTAISHARLSAQASGAGPLAHVTNTRNCDWWFFEKAVVLDTAGRYAVPVDEEADNREWEEFLHLLAAHRRREPLNGLVLTLSVEQLQGRSEEALADYGRLLRRRINAMLRALGADFPVYVLVTKMDHVLGFAALADLLDREECHQALGLLNRQEEQGGRNAVPDAMAFLEETLGHVQERLTGLSLLLVVQSRTPQADATLLPAEFARLFPGLRAFVRAVFAPSAYGDTPRLRGLFFSSGRQEGRLAPSLFADLATFQDCTWNLPGTGKSLFLDDFFTTILPRERRLWTLNGHWLSPGTLRRHAPYMAYLLLLLLAGGYFSVSFYGHTRALEAIRQSMPAEGFVQRTADMDTRVKELSNLADTIQGLEEHNARLAFLVPGREQTGAALDELKRQFVAATRTGLLATDRDSLAAALDRLPPDRQRLALIYLCDFHAWVHRVLQAARDGKPLPQAMDSVDSLARQLGNVAPAGSVQLDNVLASYARWEAPHIRDTELAQQGLRVDAYLDLLGTNLDWLVAWLDSRPSLTAVRMADFWPGRESRVTISPAHTKEGWERMEAMLATLAGAARDQRRLEALAEDFRERHARATRAAWWKFAAAFTPDLATMDQASLRQSLVAMAGRDNPYFRFLARMAEAFEPLGSRGHPGELDALPGRFAGLVQGLARESSPATLQTSLAEKGRELVARVDRDAALEQTRQDEGVRALSDYLAALEATRQATRTDSDALLLVSAGYGGGQEAAKTPVSQALQAIGRLEHVLDGAVGGHEAFWGLVKGPLACQIFLSICRSGCELNHIWGRTVLARAGALPPEELWNELSGENSSLATFLSGPAAPFIQASPGGWHPTSWLGLPYPVRPELLSFLDQGIEAERRARDKYEVGITALPINVNRLAEKPYRARLRLECGDRTQVLDNYNYQVSGTFTWEPAVCGKVSLEISFEGQSVTTEWDGEWAFQTFLSDLSGGELLLVPSDFPGQEDVLANLDVTEIRVRYTFRGADEALMARRTPDVVLPAEAAFCPTGMGNIMGESRQIRGLAFPTLATPKVRPDRPRAKPKAKQAP